MRRFHGAPLVTTALLVAGCGDDTTRCSVEERCPPGSYCFDGECRTDCDPSAQDCPTGICTSDGRCARDQPDPAAGVCAAMVLDAQFGIPTVVLLVDQSGSMDQAYSGGTRWTVLHDALMDATTGIITQMQGEMRFGLTLYTNDRTGSCPDLTVVTPALANRDAIALVYDPAQPSADTPTGESIDAVVQALGAFPEPGTQHIILATDGEPDTCADPNGDGKPGTVAAAQRAFAAGITLYIISVGQGVVSLQHLQDMANAGVGLAIGGTTNAPYYEASDSTQLSAAFTEITGRLLTCDLTVNGTIDPAAVQTGIIYLDGHQLTRGDADGWEVIDTTSFRLLGDACARAQRSGGHVVTAEFGCEEGESPRLRAAGGGAVDRGCSALPQPGVLLLLALTCGLRSHQRRGQHPRA